MPGNTSIFRGRDQETLALVLVSGNADVVLSAGAALRGVLRFEGTLEAAIDAYLPVQAEDAGLQWVIENATDGGFAITLRGPAGSGAACEAGAACAVYWNGASVRPAGGGLSSFVVTAGGSEQTVLLFDHTYVNADFPASSSSHPDYSVLTVTHKNLADTANIASPVDLIWTGLRSHVQYGSGAVDARGTEHAQTLTVEVLGAADPQSVCIAEMGWVRANGAVNALGYSDWAVHGNLVDQSSYLGGLSMLVNSYVDDSPVAGPAAAAWFVTMAGRGAGREGGHEDLQTYPLDHLVGLFGFSALGLDDSNLGRATNKAALAIGEWGSGWGTAAMDAEGWFQSCLSLRGGEVAALLISDPHADDAAAYVGSAIQFETRISGRNWLWHWNTTGAEAPENGAMLFLGDNSESAGRLQWGTSNAPAVFRSANNTLREVGKRLVAPAAIAAAVTDAATFAVHDGANAELARFRGTSIFSSVFMELGPGLAAALRLYPAELATAIDLVQATGGLIVRGSYWDGAAPVLVDASLRLDMIDDSPAYAISLELAGQPALTVDQDLQVTVAEAFHHAGTEASFFGEPLATQPTVTGSAGGNAALISLLSALDTLGLIVDGSS